jgi:hypothetical protein
MPLSYENRRGEIHYVKAAKTKKGGTRYYIVKNISKPEELIDEMPEGFEFYEFPEDALVSFRKILKTNITDEDFAILDNVMNHHETVQDYLINKEETALTVYISQYDEDLLSMLTDDQFRQMQRFDEKLRFEKSGENAFQAQRFCFISKHWGWITMETSDDLKYLAEKYCYHINKESLLEFWKEGEEEPEMVLLAEISGNRIYGYK